MTEAEWLACADPQQMLSFVQGRASDRKLRLFGAACCWERGALLYEEANRRCLAAFVRFADGEVTWRKAQAARDAAFPTWGHVSILQCPDAGEDAYETALGAAGPATPTEYFGRNRNAAQARLLRDIFGNPFRPVGIDPAWRTPDVARLAQAAYEEGFPQSGFLDADCLAVLADALEDAGCQSEEVLLHLRGRGPHVKGCWAVDALLGRG
jgi:hypothetical protein